MSRGEISVRLVAITIKFNKLVAFIKSNEMQFRFALARPGTGMLFAQHQLITPIKEMRV